MAHSLDDIVKATSSAIEPFPGLVVPPPTSVDLTQLPGYKFCHKEYTGNVSVTHTTEAAADTVVTAPDITFDGATTVLITFFSALARVSAVTSISFWWYDGSTSLGDAGQLDIDTANAGSMVMLGREMTPAAGAHSISVRASVGSGTGTVFAASGGAGNAVPGYIRIVRS